MKQLRNFKIRLYDARLPIDNSKQMPTMVRKITVNIQNHILLITFSQQTIENKFVPGEVFNSLIQRGTYWK